MQRKNFSSGMTRRKFVKTAGIMVAGAGLLGVSGISAGCGSEKASVEKNVAAAEKLPDTQEVSKVYFTKKIDSENLIKLYQKVNGEISGKVAVKLHSGEPHGPNIIPPDMVKPFQAQIPNSTIIEANTAYGSARASTDEHKKTLEINGWTFCPVDIIDEEGDVNFPVNGGFHLQEIAYGSHLTNYDSLVVLTHFKGHARLAEKYCDRLRVRESRQASGTRSAGLRQVGYRRLVHGVDGGQR